jgi:hypothetical protein
MGRAMCSRRTKRSSVAPSTYRLVCRTSAKSSRRWEVRSLLQTMYRQQATTLRVLLPWMKLCCTASEK